MRRQLFIIYFATISILACTSEDFSEEEYIDKSIELIGSWQGDQSQNFNFEKDTIWGRAKLSWYWPPNSFYFDYIDERWELIIADNGAFQIEEVNTSIDSISLYLKIKPTNSSQIIEGWVNFHFIEDGKLWIEIEENSLIFPAADLCGQDNIYYRTSGPTEAFKRSFSNTPGI